MSKNATKTSVFSTIEEDIRLTTNTPEEAEHVRQLLKEAEEQSRKQDIIRIREPRSKLIQFLKLWQYRFKYGVHWRKPLYPVRLARNLFLGQFYKIFGIKKYVLRGLEISATYKCNFRCNHCLCARLEESNERKELTPEEWSVVVKDAMKLGAITFGLEGGEPFVQKHWVESLKAFKPKYNHIIISSNGWLFDEEKAKKCRELGVDTINFSLDSGIPELHDAFRRKKGSFDRVMKAIDLCKKYGIKVIINTTIHKGNIYTEGFIKLLEISEEKKILVNTLLAKGVGNFKDKDAQLTQKDLENYGKIIEPYNYVTRHLAFNNSGEFGCPGTKEMINFTPYGDVLNCANMHIYLGNVLDQPLKEIRKNAIEKTPFGLYAPCFLADDPDFMEIYYNFLEKKPNMSIEEFNGALKEYETKNNKVVYPELNK